MEEVGSSGGGTSWASVSYPDLPTVHVQKPNPMNPEVQNSDDVFLRIHELAAREIQAGMLLPVSVGVTHEYVVSYMLDHFGWDFLQCLCSIQFTKKGTNGLMTQSSICRKVSKVTQQCNLLHPLTANMLLQISPLVLVACQQ